MTTPIPVTLLTGFLGSGKTTLLNALLHHPDMERAAVVINEFGEIGLDHDLIESSTEAMILMSSGCLCCTVRGDLITTLMDLRERRKAGEIAFDRVVIETTGIADPGPIVQTMVMDPELSFDFALDGVLTTADAVNGARTLDDNFEAVQQVAMADRIIVTKGDMVTPTSLKAFETRIERINPGATRHVVEHGQIAPSLLFGLAPMGESDKQQALDWVGKASPAPRSLPPLSGFAPQNPLGGAQSHGLFGGPAAPAAPATAGVMPGPRPTSHSGRISSQSVELTTPVPSIVFDLWLESLITSIGADVLRLKAVIHVEGMDHPFALHGVQQIFHPPVPLPHWPKGDTVSRIVVIGRDLPPGYLNESLAVLNSRPPVTVHTL